MPGTHLLVAPAFLLLISGISQVVLPLKEKDFIFSLDLKMLFFGVPAGQVISKRWIGLPNYTIKIFSGKISFILYGTITHLPN